MSQLNLTLAKVKTLQANSTVTAATNASPIAVTTSAAHGLETGDIVQLSGAVGNTAANGQFVITKTSSTAFTLNNSNGNGAWSSGGTVVHVGFATAGTLIDNTVFANPPDFTLQARIESLSAGSNIHAVFEDTADSNFVTALPVIEFALAGAVASAGDAMFTARSYKVPDLRIGSSGNNLRVKVFVTGGQGSVVQFSAWIVY